MVSDPTVTLVIVPELFTSQLDQLVEVSSRWRTRWRVRVESPGSSQLNVTSPSAGAARRPAGAAGPVATGVLETAEDGPGLALPRTALTATR